MSSPRPVNDRTRARRAAVATLRRALQAGALASALLVLGGWSFFDPFHAWIEKGNRDARQRKADEALGNYDAAGERLHADVVVMRERAEKPRLAHENTETTLRRHDRVSSRAGLSERKDG